VFAFPSFFEGFGLPPLEAMTCGVPVVATDRTSVPEVLGDAPVYVNPADLRSLADAMQAVLEDAKLRSRLVEAGLRRGREFNPRRTGAAMKQVVDACRAQS
jgi:glycosyltransferase involved in cell wall biosynthesis